MNYENIHCHSHASIRDSIAKIEEMAKRNKELGMKCLCITDHGSVLATTEAFKEAEKHGLKPIIGCELYVVDEEEAVFIVGKKGERRGHFILIPKNWEAMTRLFKIMTHAAKNKFSGFPRVSYQYLLDANLDDMLVSGACSAGLLTSYRYEEIAMAFHKKCGDSFYLEIIPVSYIDTKITNKYNEIKDKIKKEEDVSDEEKIYFEGIPDELINTDGIDGGKLANTRAVDMHKKHGIRLTATNDSHYVRKEDSVTHEVLLAINSGKKMSNPDRWRFGNGQIYIKSFDEMIESFEKLKYIDSDIVKMALLETNKICNEVNIAIPKFYANLPSPTPEIDDVEALNSLVDRGIKEYKIDDKANKEEYYSRIKEEMEVLNEFGLERYFLIVADIYDFMRENKIPHGYARGSVAGSIVAYLAGITYVDSIEYGCIFSRFINAGRMNKIYQDGKVKITTDDMCDVDCDVSKSRRGEVIDYVREKYGHEYVSQITNYNKFTPKNTFKAVASVFEVPFKEANRLSSFIEDSSYIDEKGDVIPYHEIDSFKHNKELKNFFKESPNVLDHILKINGTMNSLGRHAGGLIVSSIPISDVCPIDIRDNIEVANLNMHDISSRGCLKLDILGLATSDQIFNACETAGISPYTVPLKDEKTDILLSSADTTAIFQMESFLAKKTLKDTGKGDLISLAGINACIRPGVLRSKDKDGITTYTKYVKRANGSMDIEYLIPELKEMTEDTYGNIIMQEQVIKIFNKLANFSLQEADIIRRAVGKKKLDVIGGYKDQFIQGCKKNKINEEDSTEIFNLILNSSSYLFNYSHSLSYSMSSYRSAYLKVHHPVDFWASTLTYAAKKELMEEYIKDSKRNNVDVLYPDINKSSASEFTIHDKKILTPLSSIKGVGPVAADFIIQARPKDGFKSYDDFLNVLTEKKLNGKINVRVKNILYRANAFKSLGYYVQDKQERRNNLRELLSLFSPMPSLNFKTGRGVDKVAYQELITTAKKCSQRARNGNFVSPVGGVRPSIFVVMDISKSNTTLFETPYTNWFPEHLRIRLDVPKGALYFSNALKCSHYNIEKKDIPGTCWTLCTREFLKREIEIIQPRLVINTVSKVCPWISGVKGLRFAESFGKIYFSAITDSYVINIPSAQWIKYSEEIRDIYKAEIIPLLESLNKDQK